MLRSLSLPKLAVIAVLIAGVAVALTRWSASPDSVEVTMPSQLSSLAQQGRTLFAANCAECHGDRAGGTDKGPPFVHAIYNPGHHADLSFVLAVQNGVRAHHWPFGDMPPQPQVSGPDVAAIVQFVREVQLANGIGGSRR